MSGEGRDELDLDRRVQRQGGDADGATRVPAGVPEDPAQQLARAVDHLRLTGEARGAGDEADDLDDPELVEVGDRGRGGERVEGADPRELGGVRRGDEALP